MDNLMQDRLETSRQDAAADPQGLEVAKSMSVAPVREPITVTGQEKAALALAVVMMLTPLAMAAWGAHHIY